MPEAERTIVIDRPAAQAFAFFSDPGNDPKWRPAVKEISAQPPTGVGSTIHQTVKGPGGRGIPSDFEVMAYEPSSRYSFKVTAGPVWPVGEFRFAPSGSGTEVTLSLSAELSGIKKLLLAKPVQTSMNSEVAAALDKAKALIEST
ncbi:polyketide cyclase/dehydrase/lipid transport protein [Kribbella orskensis]|uniref:Polyketide cyclase/dehydrase/lipid transport protein n=1 Tax=Kribbella orskensis TaxID=2512216 RepID=A0ABY2BSI9_9ACTN|nr:MULTISPECIES: SRPBCC family protein [Kribbella]TCN42984.1 polyketide cyclase/dehydrase/lipid transport protein [Kribbella sp. VKM Ac-2500]TCO29660.1 polyketide cyclase/dehydrase/lipid transport protein [Kribbella orskensis]